MNTRPKIKLEYGIHKQQQVVFVRFAFNQDIINRLKETTPARWSATKGCWYILSEKLKLNSFFESFKGIAYINYSELKKHQEKACKKELSPKKNLTPKIIVELPPGYLEKLEQLRRSPNTIKIYTSYFKDFTRHFNKRDLVQIDHDEINSYITGLIREYRISSSQQNQRINAIKFFYEQVLGKEKQYYDILRPAKERKLPDILSKKEIGVMINTTKNLKHKALISLIYSCGLRRSEAINMKPGDIKSDRMLIKINGAKGKKDRYVQLAGGTLKILRKYFKKEKPLTWLFEGNKRGERYSATSIYNVVKNTARKAGIKKRVFPHILRHSFATHLLEQGVDLRLIQQILGHENSKTTEIYTHVSNNKIAEIKNPIDDIFNGTNEPM